MWRELSGTAAPPADDEADVAHAPQWTALGEVTCRTVYGQTYPALRRHVARLHPALDAWMLVDGYGKVLSRPALPLAIRERCIAAVCAAADQRPQLGSHLRGALRCGVSIAQLESTLQAIADLATPSALAAARAELARIAAAHAPITEAP
jgi:4-carboxymuconolactone decarboxylase